MQKLTSPTWQGHLSALVEPSGDKIQGWCGLVIYQKLASSNILNYQIQDFKIDGENKNLLIANNHHPRLDDYKHFASG